MAALFGILLTILLLPQGDCQDWPDCRQRALDAAARQEYEAFHDLAWRAVQKGPKNEPSLMYLLARAQSLSGRPHDALVMLRRLFEMGVPTDAPASEDFDHVRALAAWPELEALLRGLDRLKPDTTGEVVGTRDLNPSTRAPTGPVGAATVEVARLEPGAAVAPAGLAYDAVSKRFIIGDSAARKLKVIDEFSHHIVTLAGADATGFGDITALEIDGRQGDLWVASARASGEPGATLHKLQLISARLLEAFALPVTTSGARFVDIAVADDSAVFALDGIGRRVFRVRPRAHALELVATLEDTEPTSIAAARGVVYVGHRDGLARIDSGSGASAAVRASGSLDVSGLMRIRWHRGSLVAIQRRDGEASRVVRIRFDRAGRTALALEVLDPDVRIVNATAAAIADDVLYYLAGGADGVAIWRTAIR